MRNETYTRPLEVQKPAHHEWVSAGFHQLEKGDIWRYVDDPSIVYLAVYDSLRDDIPSITIHSPSHLDNCILDLYKINDTKNVRASLDLLRKERKSSSWYCVQSGDTLSQLAEAFFGDASRYVQIAKDNKIPNADLIYAGQWIRIPSYVGN